MAHAAPSPTTITLNSGSVLPEYQVVVGGDENGGTATVLPCGGGGATTATVGQYNTIDGTDWVTPWDGAGDMPLQCYHDSPIGGGDGAVTEYTVPFSLSPAHL